MLYKIVRLAYRLLCRIRQGLRRSSWLLLFALGLLLYPAQVAWQVSRATAGLSGPEARAIAASTAAQVVAPDYLFSKLSIAVGVFCLINLLAWAALNMALPVLANWATGRYGTERRAQAVGLAVPISSFKGAFLNLSDYQRICVYFLGFGLELLAAGLGVWAAFTIQ